MLKQSLQQKLLQKLSPQQIQLMKLLQVPTMDLEQRVKEELEENPALEEGLLEQDEDQNVDEDTEDESLTEAEREFDVSEYMDDDIPAYKLSVKNKGVDDEEKSIPISGGASFHDLLEQQIDMQSLNEQDYVLALQIIGNLDDSGYLRRELDSIVDDIAFSLGVSATKEDLQRVLTIIQQFDPPGVGARNLQECLSLQLKRKEHGSITISIAKEVVRDHFELFTKKHYDKIIKKMEVISEDDLKLAIDEIIKLNPKPGNSLQESSKITQHIIPDFILNINDDKLELSLNGRNAPQLKVSGSYKEMLRGYAEGGSMDKSQKEAAQFVKHKIDGAKWFIDAIKQRQQTLMLTMNAILSYQESFFLEGDETLLKPMILKDIAEMVQMDISTISRVANSKYIQTPYGTYLLKYFFSESLSTDSGEEVSTREVKKILQEAIEAEDKHNPLTDEKLTNLLTEKGYNIARRTVAKYREQLNMPVARLRKEM
jgi:RNA polymerase sigma-54 factor